ncbi:MAG: 4-methyl-5(b-hydroxyethyl)-thiazole monophosphate biosynthesis [Oceanicoccus sp.]|jgi:4-methyl-5(b-hydroxyethyl)-thiazole monophosphate biosynthesis
MASHYGLPCHFESGEEALSEPFLAVIRHFNEHNKLITSVCVSSLALGTAGILKDRNATTYHQHNGLRKQQLEQTGARFVDLPVVCDGNCI